LRIVSIFSRFFRDVLTLGVVRTGSMGLGCVLGGSTANLPSPGVGT
jgi:hypothetical protein